MSTKLLSLPIPSPPYKGAKHCLKCHDYQKRIVKGVKIDHACPGQVTHTLENCPGHYYRMHAEEISELKDKAAEELQAQKEAEAEAKSQEMAAKKRKTSINSGFNQIIKSTGYDASNVAPPELLQKMILAVKAANHAKPQLTLEERKNAAHQRGAICCRYGRCAHSRK
eukprot:TRINITY_DN4391_c1_g1_i3.p1 TRINITY_DN4391_c1_g1~~TRINITY_DN4391_c1_g1_i3.p1  ORF type:complete len:190 (+),score=17.04 TRINITY_DN4391_c1_g1_i3:68-571(+)